MTEVVKAAQEYFHAVGESTLSAFFDSIFLEKGDATRLAWKMVENGILEYTVGFVYRYVGEEEGDESIIGNEEYLRAFQAEKYLKSVKEITFNAYKHKEKLSDEEAEEILADLVERGVLQRVSSFLLRYKGDGDAEGDLEAFVLKKDEKPKGRNWLDDDFDQNDCIEARYKKLCEKQKKANSVDSEKKYMDLFEMRKKADEASKPLFDDVFAIDDDDDDDDDDVFEESVDFEGLSYEGRLLLRELEKITMRFGIREKFVREDDHYVCELGITYPDDSLMRFKVYYNEDGKEVLSDCGLTYKAMSKYFNFDEENVAKRIESILDEYPVKMKKEGDERELYVRVVDSESAFLSFLWFFVSIEKIVNLKSEHLLYTLGQDLDCFCKDEIYRVFFQDRATYDEAKNTFEELLSKATAENDHFKISSYKTLLSMVNDITEEAYKEFVEYMLKYLTLRLDDLDGEEDDEEDDGFDVDEDGDFDEADSEEMEFWCDDFDDGDFDEDENDEEFSEDDCGSEVC